MRYLKVYLMSLLFTHSMLHGEMLTLDDAIHRALHYSPTIAVANSEIDIMQAAEYQTYFYPNPQFAIQVDGANCITKKSRKTNDQEITYSLSQLFELGGKRPNRQQIAAFQTSLAAYDTELVKLDILNAVKKAVVDVIAAQEFVRLSEEQLRISLEMLATTSAKVKGGKISVLQERKADLARITATLNLERARRELALAKKKLGALWGDTCLDFEIVDFPLFSLIPLENICILIDRQSNNLEAMRWDLQIALGEKIIVGEKAQRIPDVIVTAGYYTCEDDGNSLLLGFSMPIPIFDQNQGNICRAKHQLNQFYEKKNEAMVHLRIDLEDAYNQLLSAYKLGVSYQENLISSAKAAFDAAKEEYTRGKNDYLELLDAQRTLFDVQEQFISTLVEYHHRKADVDRLVGLPLANFCPQQNF